MISTSREFGVLMHPSSLPGGYGIGEIGFDAFRFVDWLADVGAKVWQILPLVPTGAGNSPYSTWSAFSCNPMLIDLQFLVREGLLPAVENPYDGPTHRVDFARASFKMERLFFAANNLLSDPSHHLYDGYREFLENASWVEEAALFRALKDENGMKPWWQWPAPIKHRDQKELDKTRARLSEQVQQFCVVQYIFDIQWRDLRAYCRRAGIEILGDMPIYVDADSVDVWANQGLFLLSDDGQPASLAGVPPDAFSATGQLWGNPIYDWQSMAEDGYRWWIERMARALELTDRVRIDHFRGLSAYWSVPRGATDAREGVWIKGPGEKFFDTLRNELGENLPIVAEDLGTIDEDVVDLVRYANVPNMLVLQFAFGGENDNWYLPHHHREASVVYTGTHDNNTTLGWWVDAPESVKHHVRTYFGTDGHDIVWTFIRAAFSSLATTAIIPVQDLLGLGAEARMNIPSVGEGNWAWRVQNLDGLNQVTDRIRTLAELYSRR